jgi:predicted CXXCH cytochrome family protein
VRSPTERVVRRSIKILLPGLLAGFIMLISCSPQMKYSVLNIFFDGVPEPEQFSNKRSADSLMDFYVSKQEPVSRRRESPYFFHQPYQANECKACHKPGNLGMIISEADRLCNYCHDSFADIYANIHGPADSGKCMLCHDPHMSKNESMLIRPGRALCTYCHQEDQLSEKSHTESEENNCLGCHNPHGGGQYYLIE